MRIPGTPFSDNDPFVEQRITSPLAHFLTHRKEVGKTLYDFIARVRCITDKDLLKNHSEELLFANTVEELGEYAAAKTVEKGIKKKKLKESSLVESVDLVICSLSLFFANGGKLDDLCKIGQEKLNKWEERVKPK